MPARDMTPSTVARDVGRDSRQLSGVEQSALRLLAQRAAEAQPVTQLDISLAIGSQNSTGSTASGVLNRLEAKGYIERNFYQRGVQVCIVETGECTAPPACQAAHWRKREQGVQSPTIAAVRERHPSLARVIEIEAQAARQPLHTFLMDLVYNGLELYLDSKGIAA